MKRFIAAVGVILLAGPAVAEEGSERGLLAESLMSDDFAAKTGLLHHAR